GARPPSSEGGTGRAQPGAVRGIGMSSHRKRCLVAIACLAAALAAATPAAAAEPAQPEPSLAAAEILGAMTGFTLGGMLGGRTAAGPPRSITALGPADAAIAGATLALFFAPRLFDRSSTFEIEPAPESVNGFDQALRRFVLGRRSLEKRALLDRLSWG